MGADILPFTINSLFATNFFAIFKAAFERLSVNIVKPLQPDEYIDTRTCKLPEVRPRLDDFDPREHRSPKAPISNWMAYFNLIRSGFGAGMLGMPFAISQLGLILGPCITLFAGLLVVHCHVTLLWCLNEISRQLRIPYISYRYGFRLALLHGPYCLRGLAEMGPNLIAVVMIISQLGICTVFVILTTDSLRDMMDWNNSQPAMMCLILPFLILQILMKSLKIVSYISLLGNFMNVLGLALVFYQCSQTYTNEVRYANIRSVAFVVALGTIFFNTSAIGVLLSMEHALKDPKVLTKPFGVINVGLSLIIIVSAITGVMGYLAFSTMDENVLRSLPFDDNISMAAMGCYMISVTFAFPIQSYPAVEIIVEVITLIDPEWHLSTKTIQLLDFIGRIIFVLLAFLICYFLPYQGPFVAFVGNTCTTLITIIFPTLMELCLDYPDNYGKYNFILWKNIIILISGIIMWGSGALLTAYSLYIRVLASQSVVMSEWL